MRTLGLACFSPKVASCMSYAKGLALQLSIEERVAASSLPDTLIILERCARYAVGSWDLPRQKRPATLLRIMSPDDGLLMHQELKSSKIDLHRTARGGDITYHGPGQLVAYPIVNLRRLGVGVREFVETLEDVMIDVCAYHGVGACGRQKDQTGVWVDDRKIGQIGIRVSKGISSHGLSLNVDPDLAYFKKIVACGISDKEVTSLRREKKHADAGGDLDFDNVSSQLAESFAKRMGYDSISLLESNVFKVDLLGEDGLFAE